MKSVVEVDALHAAFWFALACGLAFIFGYSKLVPWWRRRAGWVAVLHGFADIMFVTPFCLNSVWHWLGAEPWFLWYFVASEFLGGSIELVRLWIVYTEIRRRRVPPARP